MLLSFISELLSGFQCSFRLVKKSVLVYCSCNWKLISSDLHTFSFLVKISKLSLLLRIVKSGNNKKM